MQLWQLEGGKEEEQDEMVEKQKEELKGWDNQTNSSKEKKTQTNEIH